MPQNMGFGLSLRAQHYAHVLQHKPDVDWFEVISENFLDTDGKPKRNLARIREHYPIALHGVSLSIGTIDPLNTDYLKKLKTLIEWVQPPIVSDHLCWTGIAHKKTHDLLPVPYTPEALKHIVQRITQVQDYLGRQIALENPSTYLQFSASAMPEAEFMAQMAQQADCAILLDINNVYVTCYNHGLDVQQYLAALPLDRVAQIHLAGHTNHGTHIVDTHDAPVTDPVWHMYQYIMQKAGRIIPTMVEWDDNIPDFTTLHAELNKAKQWAQNTTFNALPIVALQPVVQSMQSAPLPQLQHTMQQAIIADNPNAPLDWIAPKAHFDPAQQLAVYQQSYRQRLYDSLTPEYTVLAAYLGHDAFATLLQAFIANSPPTHFNIARFAWQLPHFVQQYLPADTIAQQLCTLETAMVRLSDATETTPLQVQHVAHWRAEDLMHTVLQPRKALQLMLFTHDVHTYYSQVLDNQTPVSPPPPAPTFLAVWRHDDVIWRLPLEAEEYTLLQSLFNGQPVGAALDSVPDSVSEKISYWFARWMQHSLLAYHEEKIHVA